MEKSAVRELIIAKLEAELALQTAAAQSSRDEATDSDSRAEGKFDMRGQSAAYLAAGQAKLASEIAEAIKAYRSLQLREFVSGEAIAIGAIVSLESGNQRTVYFVGPARGGLEVEIGGVPVVVITAASSLGRSLFGKHEGDLIVIPGRGTPAAQRVAALE